MKSPWCVPVLSALLGFATHSLAGDPVPAPGLVLFRNPASEPAPAAMKAATEETRSTVEIAVMEQMREFEDKAKASDGTFESLKKSTACQEVADTLRRLKENPKDLGKQGEVARAMLRRIEEIETPLRSLLTAGFEDTRDRLVKGLNVLGESQSRRSEMLKMRGASDDRFMTLSGVVGNFDLSYRELAKQYEQIPIADQLKRVKKDLDYLGAVKDVLTDIEKHAAILASDQRAIDALTQLSSTLAELEGSLLEFSDTVLHAVLFPAKAKEPQVTN